MFTCLYTPSRYAHITTRATASMVLAFSPPSAPSFMSASTISRVTVNLVPHVRDPITLMHKEWKISVDSVRRILETFMWPTEINSSSQVNELLLFLVKNYLYRNITFWIFSSYNSDIQHTYVCACVFNSAARGQNPTSAAFPAGFPKAFPPGSQASFPQQPRISHQFCLST